VVAVAVMSTALVVGGTSPLAAAPQVKTLQASCKGADPASQGYLGVLGTSSLPITVTSDVPATLEPEQDGDKIGFTVAVNLSQQLVDTAAGLVKDGLLSLANVKIDVTAGGPGLKSAIVVEGRPANQTIQLVKGQPAGISNGPFSGTLTGVGKGGLIKYSLTRLEFTIATEVAAIGKINVNLICSAPGTVAVTNIPIPGAPVITQPIAVSGTANQPITVDVLGQFVKPGTNDEDPPRTLPVDPASLKVLEGPAEVKDGKIVVTAAESASVLFEVCATESLPGVNEVQRLTIDPTSELLKKGVAFTLKAGNEVTKPIDLVGFDPIAALLGLPVAFNPADADPTNPQVWKDNANKYIFSKHELPSPADIKTALEALPSIGAGGVEVYTVDKSSTDPEQLDKPLPAGQYDIVFTGRNGEKDVPELTFGNWWSIFPQEVLDELLSLVNSIGGGGGGGASPVPPGMTTQQYFDELIAQFRAALDAGNWDLAGQKLGAALALVPRLILDAVLANIDEILSFITGLFTVEPVVATQVNGEEPLGICSQGVIDVAIASAGASGGGAPGGVQAATAAKAGAALAFAG
jgi:hypothetical protein